jgi:uncharacterized protein DUF3293
VHSAWGPYAETVLCFPEVKLAIDLRLPLPAAIPKRLSQLGLTGSFGVVTACNPRGITLDAGANRRLTAELAAVVRERYPAARLAQGASPDGRHEEPGWAIAAPLPELKRLAAEFRQNALFWFDGARFVIVPVLGQGPPLPLPAAPPR